MSCILEGKQYIAQHNRRRYREDLFKYARSTDIKRNIEAGKVHEAYITDIDKRNVEDKVDQR